MLMEIREGVANLTDVVARKAEPTGNQSVQLLREIREGIANLADVVNRAESGLSPKPGQPPKLPENRPQFVSSDLRVKSIAGREDRSEVIAEPGKPSAKERLVRPTLPFTAKRVEQPVVRPFTFTNDLDSYVGAFQDITPYSGEPPRGFHVDWAGIMTDASFFVLSGADPLSFGGSFVQTRLPTIPDGEGWFENVSWVEAAREARDHFVMITLGACFGAQAVGSYRLLQMLNPMPCKLVAVEPDPGNQAWVDRHFRNNGIDPLDHWIVGSAISDTREPVFFPVGGAGTGAQNCFSTNERGAREAYVAALASSDHKEEVLRNLLLYNTTGLEKTILPGGDFDAEIKLVSAVTLDDILGPFDRVDFLEVDIQQSEVIVFPPFMDLVKRKVRRVHLGTHGRDVHETLASLFRRDGWEIIFDYRPNDRFETPHGTFETNDGVLTVRNPTLERR